MPENEEKKEERQVKQGHRLERAGKLIATAGLIVLLILGAWGIIVLAFNAPEFLNNIERTISGFMGNNAEEPEPPSNTPAPTLPETLSVTAASNSIPSGQSVIISWNHQNAPSPRGFLITWKCAEGLTMEAPLADGTYRSVACNTAFNYTNAQSETTLRARLTGASPQTAVVEVSAISLATGSTTASASASITVQPSALAPAKARSTTSGQAATKPAVTSYTTQPKKVGVSNPYGTPDLAVRIIAIGYIDPQTGAFVPLPAVYGQNYNMLRQYPSMAVRFEIKNVGTKTVPAGWQFTANIPLQPPYLYTSAPQAAVTPGSGIVFTLGWNPLQNNCHQYQTYQHYEPCTESIYPYQNQNIITITADPYGMLSDYNRGNNSASTSI